MPKQLHFDWPPRVTMAAEDFFVSDANALAYAQVTNPDAWTLGKLALIGPPRSGKSHLAKVFQHQTGAQLVTAAQFPDDLWPEPGASVIVEDMETMPNTASEAMFHLHNHLAATGGRLLLTSDRPPARWTIDLADLASRLQATHVTTISDPDDRLLAAVIMKLFQDRQIAPSPGLATYLATRIERSFAAAVDMVTRIDAVALSQKREVNETLARALLDKP